MSNKSKPDSTTENLQQTPQKRLHAIIDAIFRVAENLILTGTSQWATTDQQSLKLLAQATNASCISLYRNPSNRRQDSTFTPAILWKAPEAQNNVCLIESPDWENFQKLKINQLKSHNPVSSTDWSKDEPALKILSQYKIQNILILPVHINNQLWGGLCFEQSAPQNHWTEDELAALKAGCLILTQAIQHHSDTLQVRSSEHNYRSIVEHQTDLITRFDSNHLINFVNDACCQYYDLRKEDILGKNIQILIPGQFQKPVLDGLNKLTPQHPIFTIEHINVSAKGENRIFQWRNQAFFDKTGKVVEFLAVGRDVTEKKQLETALRLSEERFRTISQIVSDYVYSIQFTASGKTTFQWLNAPPQNMFDGAAPALKESNQWIQFIHPEDIPLAEKHLEKVLSGQFDSIELRYIRPNGQFGWLRDHGWPEISETDLENQLPLIFGAGNDITENKLAELKMLKSEREKALILDSLSEIVDYLDLDLNIIWANKTAADSLGLSKEDLIGKHCFNLWHNRDEPCKDCPVKRSFETGRFQEGQIKGLDGRVWHVAGNPISNEKGEIIGVVETTLDITERAIAEERLWRRVTIEELVTNLSTHFINLSAYQVDGEIHKALRKLAEFVGSNRGFITLLSSDGKTIHKEYDWFAKDIQPQYTTGSTGFSVEKFDWSMTKLKRHENLFLPLVSDLPDEASPEREYWLAQDIQSILAIPLVLNEMLIGYWGFISNHKTKQWQEDDLLILKLMGDVLINVIVRKEAEDALRRERDFAEGLIETAQVIVLVLDTQGQISRFNPYFEMLSGYQMEETVGKNWFDAFVPEEHREVQREFFLSAIQFGKISTQVYPITTRIEQQLNIEWHSRVLKNTKGEIIGVLSTGQDITERLRSEKELRETNKALNESYKQLKKLHDEATLLNQMAELFQNCQDIDEVYKVVTQYIEQLFPDQAGALYIKNQDTKSFHAVLQWGQSFQGEQAFFANDCWALRRNAVYRVDHPHITLRCPHMNEELHQKRKAFLCVPLTTQENIIGMFHLQGGEAKTYEHIEQLALTIAEHTAMTISNITLQNRLKMQSIRDTLTGLFNRRYMDETLERELLRSIRQKNSICLLMLDIDRFKQYNDTHGHEAGDILLQSLGEFLMQHVRSSDVACRYGGEEFIIILPETNLEEAKYRAEELRSGIKELVIRHRGHLLDTVTVSIGVSAYPNHGKASEALLRAADTALYKAKAEGRDRVVVSAY